MADLASLPSDEEALLPPSTEQAAASLDTARRPRFLVAAVAAALVGACVGSAAMMPRIALRPAAVGEADGVMQLDDEEAPHVPASQADQVPASQADQEPASQADQAN